MKKTAPASVDIAGHLQEILRGLGEDPGREGLLKTPERAGRPCGF